MVATDVRASSSPIHWFGRRRANPPGLCSGLARRADRSNGRSPAAKTEAIATLEGLAIFDGPEEPVFVRIGEYEGEVVVDLCDERWRVVVIGKGGWKVVQQWPIRFRRTRGMLALPTPVPDGSINDLRPFINVRTDSDFVLVCALTWWWCPSDRREASETYATDSCGNHRRRLESAQKTGTSEWTN